MHRTAPLLALLPLLLLACPTRPTIIDPPVGDDEEECPLVTVGPVQLDGQNDVQTGYSAPLLTPVSGPAPDFLVLTFVNQGRRSEAGAGSFTLVDEENANLATCSECLSVFADELDATLPPSHVLFQSAGTIDLTVDPRSLDLIATVTGLVVREVTVDPGSLESTPVTDGLCARFDTLSFDLRFVPELWTCAPERYRDGVTCDCACGAADADCFNELDEPARPVVGCGDGDVCRFDACVTPCDAFAGPGCTTGVCLIDMPQDLCNEDAAILDTAVLGETCDADGAVFACAVSDGIAQGICDIELDIALGGRTCRPICQSRADCGPDEHCFTLVGGFLDGTGKGYCKSGTPPEWLCDPALWNAADACDCNCGGYDPDCDDTAAPINGCAADQSCTIEGNCE